MTWQTKKLGEICEERREKNKKNLNLRVFTVSNIFGFVPSEEFFSKRVYSKNLKNYKLVYKNDFGYNPARVNVGSIGLFREDKQGLVSPMYVVFSIKEENFLSPDFLYYLLKTDFYQSKIRSLSASQGSIRQILKLEDLFNLEIPLPPLNVQEKIVKILDIIQEAVEIQGKIIERTKELKKSLMAELFKYGGPSFRKGRKLKKTEIGEIPENWQVVKIKEIGEVITGSTPSTSIKDYWNGKIPFVTPSDFTNDKIYVCQTARKVTQEGAQKGKIIPKDTVLVVCIGSTIGKIALSFEECITNQQINAIICNNSISEPLFVYYFLFKNQRSLKNYAGVTAKPIVKKSLFETFPIPLLSLPEQKEIAEILKTIDEKIEIEQKKKETYEELFKTLLNKIMSQKIDVEKIQLG